jgi:uroporphyrinogen-III synthase
MGALPVIVTRPEQEAVGFCSLLEKAGILARPLPLIDCVPTHLTANQKHVVAKTLRGEYGAVIFTSPRGVVHFAAALGSKNILPTELKIAAQGVKTAKFCEEYFHRVADIIPPQAISESLAEAVRSEVQPGKSILLVRPENTRGIIQQSLSSAGYMVEELILYRTCPVELSAQHELEIIEMCQDGATVACFSPSAVRHLVDIARRILSGQQSGSVNRPSFQEWIGSLRCVVFGPITAAVCREQGIFPVVEHQDGNALVFAEEIALYMVDNT